MVFRGLYFAEGSASSKEVELTIFKERLTLVVGGETKHLSLGEVHVGNLIESYPIVINSNGRYEFKFNSRLVSELKTKGFVKKSFVFDLESSFKKLILGSLALIFCIFIFFQFVLPMGSRVIAHNIPGAWLKKLDSIILSQLDTLALSRSEVDKKRQIEIKSQLENSLKGDYDLLFRKGNQFGANAFALSSNTIIITDELIDLLRKDEYILSVLFHEVGHLKNKDVSNQLVQNSFLTLLGVFIVGDASGGGANLANISVLLGTRKFMRDQERGADEFSIKKLKENDISVACFSESLKLLKVMANKGNTKESLLNIFATHPEIDERVERILKEETGLRPCL